MMLKKKSKFLSKKFRLTVSSDGCYAGFLFQSFLHGDTNNPDALLNQRRLYILHIFLKYCKPSVHNLILQKHIGGKIQHWDFGKIQTVHKLFQLDHKKTNCNIHLVGSNSNSHQHCLLWQHLPMDYDCILHWWNI